MIISCGAIVIENVFVPVCTGVDESVTVTTTLLLVPAAVGVPPITPVEALIDNPVGCPLKAQVNGAVPPAAVSEALYAAPTAPAGNDVVVMAGGPLFIVRCRKTDTDC